MNFAFAHQLASEMIQKSMHAKDFFATIGRFDSYIEKSKDEYIFAVKASINNRLPAESDEWRLKAVDFLKKRGCVL